MAVIVNVNKGASRGPLIVVKGGLTDLIRPVGSSTVLKCAHPLDAIQCNRGVLGPRITCSEIDELRFCIRAHPLIEVLEVQGGTRRGVDGLAEVFRSLLRLVAV